MRLGRFILAWGKDWLGLMSGIASVALFFWATLWPPSQAQAKQLLLVVSAICFVIGSYRIWVKENQRWRDLTEKTPVEAIDDLMSELKGLEDWYAGDNKTDSQRLKRFTDKALGELRHQAPFAVHRFKTALNEPLVHRQSFFPHRNRTVEELAAWRSDKERERCWSMASACLNVLNNARGECMSKMSRQ